MNFTFTLKVVGHLLIWAGCISFAALPWIQRHRIKEKDRLASGLSLGSLKSFRCHLLGWGEWTKCNATTVDNAKKSRQLIAPCLSKKYEDYAPCLCPLKDCPSIELKENLTAPVCMENFTGKSFQRQMLPISEKSLYHSRKDLALGRITECLRHNVVAKT